jgi:hypothetical protein
MDSIDLINKKVEALHTIKHSIHTLPYSPTTLQAHSDLRVIYLDRLGSLKRLMMDCVEEFTLQEARIQRHVNQLQLDKAGFLTHLDSLPETLEDPPSPAPHNTTIESGRA